MGEKTVERAREVHRRADIAVERIFPKKEAEQKRSGLFHPNCGTINPLGGESMKEQILAVQRMQDYISAHLSEKISLADLANAAMFSP